MQSQGESEGTQTMRYLKANWKRLLVANAISFGLQAVAFGVFSTAGIDIGMSLALAKTASWLVFALQVAWPVLRNVKGLGKEGARQQMVC